MSHSVDVAVIGASLAGASFTLGIAARGYSAAVFDRANFPRAKACGEGLSAQAVRALAALGLADRLASVPHAAFCGYSVHEPRGHEPRGHEPRGESRELLFADPSGFGESAPDHGVGIERYLLDALLVDRVRSLPNVVSRFGAKIKTIEKTRGRFRIALPGEAVEARYLVLADGARSGLAAGFGLKATNNAARRCGFSFLARGTYSAELKTVHVLLRRGFQIVCTPVGADAMNISILADSRYGRELAAPDIPADLLGDIAELTGFCGEQASPMLGAGSMGAAVRRPFADGVFAIGDCCEQLDPIGGMGMTHALVSAAIAADALDPVLSEKAPFLTAARRYAADRERAVRPLRGFTGLIYLGLVHSPSHPLWTRLRRGSFAEAIGRAVHQDSDVHGSKNRIAHGVLHAAGGVARCFV